eukprot:GHRR01036355.1.p2 GENE.GHRR01036355.1~~GHRR01036355.1.p2  ORF type:complete len:100 (-),score=22.76 GHRR01036355.1:204-503(-)
MCLGFSACCCADCRSLHEAGCDQVEILEKSMESGSVLVGDVADEIAADLVVVSSEAVHTKQVDANLLAGKTLKKYSHGFGKCECALLADDCSRHGDDKQ